MGTLLEAFMDTEIDVLSSRNTWELVSYLNYDNIVTCEIDLYYQV